MATSPVASRTILVDGIRTHFLEAGDGPPVVLLHSGEFGAAAEISWEFMIPALAPYYRVIAPDWLGYGHTDKLHDFGGGQARRIRHMRRFLELMDIGPAHFIGNSMGGTLLAQTVAASQSALPARTLGLISSGGAMPDNTHRQMLLDYDGTEAAMRTLLRAMMHDSKWSADDDYVRRRVEMSLMPGAWECCAATRFKNPTIPARSEFGRPDTTPYENIKQPVLLIAGREDRLRESGYAEDLAPRFPRAELYVLEYCGHCPHIERADDVNQIVLDFLKRHEDATYPPA